jgi:4-nitrophenyl phosphatase
MYPQIGGLNPLTQVAAVILAAGGSTRFGQCKQLLDWEGKPMLAHVADVTLQAELDPVTVVLGCEATETHAALSDRPIRTLMNWRWEEGLSTSVRTGLAGVPPEAEAVLFIQGDQPLITPDLLQTIVDRFSQTDASIIQTAHADRRSPPVLFARRFFSELFTVTGDEGGRSLIRRYPEEVATVKVAAPHVLSDVDTPEDYEQLRRNHGKESAASGRTASEILKRVRHLIIDMDGVLWRGDEPMPGLDAFFAFLKERGISFILATNNSSRTPEQYVAKLARFGVDVPVETILTSALVSAAYLADVAPSGSRVYVIGEEGIQQALLDRGFALDDEIARYVVIGWDRNLTWNELATASLLIHEGASFVGTNPDVTFPTERGPVPGNGALLAAVETATGVKPVVTGKPEPRMYQEGLRRMDATPETTAMIGDRLDTDIAGASNASLTTILVLSGIATEEDVASASMRPDLVCADIQELLKRWKELTQ